MRSRTCLVLLGLGLVLIGVGPVSYPADLMTDDGLLLHLDQNGRVTSMIVNDLQAGPGQAAQTGFFVRDYATGSLVPVAIPCRATPSGVLTDGSVPGVQLHFTAEAKSGSNRIGFLGAVTDERRTDDRAVDVVFRVPFAPKSEAIWWEDIRGQAKEPKSAPPPRSGIPLHVLRFPPITTSKLRIFQPPGAGCGLHPDTLWLAEVEIYGRDQNANLLRTGPKFGVLVDSSSQGYSPRALTDGARNDGWNNDWFQRGWCSKAENKPHWVEFAFEKNLEIARVDLYWCLERFGYATSRDFWIEYWNGEKWTRITSVELDTKARLGDAEKARFNEPEAELTTDVYPFACVTSADRRAGLGLAIPPDSPCDYRLAYDKPKGLLEITFRFGLSQLPKNPDVKGRAPFRFVLFPVDGEWGFRDAARRYYDLFPDAFRRRTNRDGLWLNGRTTNVLNPNHYAFREGGPDVADLDDAYGIYTCPYTLVGQREFESPASTYAAAMKGLAALDPARPSFYGPGLKEIIESCSLRDSKERYILRMRRRGGSYDGPAVVTFPMNPDPSMFEGAGKLTAAQETLKYADNLLRRSPELDGIYVDSLSSWGAYLNTRREHFAYADLPLTHDEDGRVVEDNHMAHIEFLRDLRARLEPKGKLVFGNGIRMHRAWCGFLCDVMGVEANPSVYADHRQYAFFRTIAYHKPFLLYYTYDWPQKDLPREAVEEYIQSAIAYSIAPEVVEFEKFGPRDADLYDKFMPVLRQIARAGWEPVTYARVSDGRIWLERFGQSPRIDNDSMGLFFTLYNPTTDSLTVDLAIDKEALRIPAGCPLKEMVSEKDLVPGASIRMELPAKTLNVLQVGAAPPLPPSVRAADAIEKLLSNREKSNAASGGLLANGGFEEPSVAEKTPGWVIQVNGNASASVTDTQAHSGKHALLIRDTDNKSYADARQSFDLVQPHKRYTLTLWVKQSPGSKHTGRVYYQWRSATERLQQGRFDFPRSSEWTRCQWTLTPPNGAVSLAISLGCSIPESTECYVDDVTLTRERKP